MPVTLLMRAHNRMLREIEWLRHGRGRLIPPRGLIGLDGSANYHEFVHIGEEFRGYFLDIGHLQPREHVLEIGSCVGRMAIPLIAYLRAPGAYAGFDIIRKAVEWCAAAISPKAPLFRFRHADIYNSAYNPGGTILAKNFTFPYEDATFDFVYATSVFTHMLPDDVGHYMSEIARVLRRGGRCLMTYFLLTPESRTHMAGPRSLFHFDTRIGESCWTNNVATPESGIAYEEGAILRLYRTNGFDISGPIRYGSWSGRSDGLSGQDLVLATRD